MEETIRNRLVNSAKQAMLDNFHALDDDTKVKEFTEKFKECEQLKEQKEKEERTVEYRMTAKEMFEKLGLTYSPTSYHHKIVVISYVNNDKFSTKVNFNLESKRIHCYFGANDELAGAINIELFKAIQKQVEELGWE